MEAKTILFLVTFTIFGSCSGTEVFFFLERNFTGKQKLFGVQEECMNIKPHHTPSSIRVDGCVAFYSQQNCLGYRFEIDNDEAVLYLNKPRSMGPCNKPVDVYLCEDADHNEFTGVCKNVPITECCLDMKTIKFDNVLTSLNTRNNCVALYDQPGCNGKKIFVKPGSASHNNLKEIGFNDAARSIQLCPPENITRPCEQGVDGPWYCTDEDEPQCRGGEHFKRLETGHGCPCGEACCVTSLLPELFRH